MSLKTVAQFTSSGGGGSGTVTSVNVSGGATGLTTSGGPVTTSGTITMAGTLAVANGGTGVTTSSGASSVVLRDANSNITGNSFFEGITYVAAAGTTTTLTAASTPTYVVTGSGGQTYKLPDATTLSAGAIFSFNNNQTSGTVVVQNSAGTTLATLQSGAFIDFTLLVNSPAAGTWDTHAQTPSNVSWSTNTLDWTGSVTNATWNGVAVAPNRGGTGIANNTASTLTISGSFGTTFTITGTTSVTLPTSGTLVNTAVTTLSSLSSIGTIATGVWNGTTIAVAYGGTGVTTSTGSGSNVLSASPTLTGTLTVPTITSAASTALTIQSAGTTAATFDTSQNLNIGTATALNSARLTVVGGVTGIVTRNSGATAGKFWNSPYVDTANTLYMINNSNAGVYISDGGVAWVANSDERLKDIISPIASALTGVLSLRAVRYSWKNDEAKVARVGLIAQDVQKVLPEVVNSSKLPQSADETEYLGVAYTEVIPLLVAAIQELSAKNEALEARLAALEAKQ